MEGKKRGGNSGAKAGGSPAKKQRGGKSPAKGRKKDPNLPKKPQTPYFLFMADHRKVMENQKKQGNTDIPTRIGDVAKYIGAKWKAMTPEQKIPYEERYVESRQKYLAEVASLNPQSKRDENKPKKPKTAFFYFLEHFRAENRNQKSQEGKSVPSIAGELWQSMSNGERKPYLDKAGAASEVYKHAMQEYLKTKPADSGRQKQEKGQSKAQSKAQTKEASESEEEEDDDEDEDEDEDEDDSEEEDDSD